MTGLLQDLRYGVRTLSKSPSFTIVSLLTLALGIGATTAIFSFVDGVLLKPLPYADADRIVRVLEKPPGGDRNGISTLNYLDWRNENSVFEYMTPFTNHPATLTGAGDPIRLARRERVDALFRHLLEFTRRSAELSPQTKMSTARSTWWCSVTRYGCRNSEGTRSYSDKPFGWMASRTR